MEQFERIILKDLATKNSAIDIYYFHEKYLFSPQQIASFILKVDWKSLVKVHDNMISLTFEGHKWITDNKEIIFCPKKQPWRNIPEKFQLDSAIEIEVNQPFIPYLSRSNLKNFTKYYYKKE